jgi:phosphatidylserine/phosphatidylglycerophosphate/cardiolipin synthase-like enzyme
MDRDAAHIPFVESCPYPIRAGNRVRPLVDGDPAFRRICAAVESAKHSVWVTVAFMSPGFAMPDGRGNLFDVLDAAHARGLDVRVLFWRCPPLHAIEPDSHFPGDEAQRAMLRQRGSRFLARWDRAAKLYCQHQKSWIVDAGLPGEVAFVGGINLGEGSMVAPGHAPNARGKSTHDVYVEIEGPSAADVHHNFVQRWNEASEQARSDGHWPAGRDAGPLLFPARLSPPAGEVPVQISRTVSKGCYRDGTPAPEARAFAIHEGEFSIHDQYIAAIDAARRSIYVEDQAIGALRAVGHLKKALERGVEVVFLAPGNCHPAYAEAKRNPELKPFFELVASLDRFPNFTLAAIASHKGPGAYHEVYVHAKIMLVDDAWATIGSTNVAERSFRGDTELNASLWHGGVVSELRRELLAEHLGVDTAGLGDAEALRLYHARARENALRRTRGEAQDCLAYRLDSERYGS